jgi:hypothetical protein
VNGVIGWAFYLALAIACLAAIVWTTAVAFRFGERRLRLRDAKLLFWTAGVFIVLFLGAWLPMSLALGGRNVVRRATGHA